VPAKCLTACLVAAVGLCIAGFCRVGSAHRSPWWAESTLQDNPAKVPLKLVDYGAKDPRLKGYFLPEGFKLEIVAEGELLGNTARMQFDERGTLHILEWSPQRIGEKKAKDKVRILRDRNGDGIYDEAQTVLECDLPHHLLFHDGWLYLADRASLRRYRSSKNDGGYDIQEEILRGFGELLWTPVAGLAVGPDGWLYVACREGKHYLVGSNGSKETVLRSGAVVRCRPDGSRLHVVARGFGSLVLTGVAFDTSLHRFLVDGVVSDRKEDTLDNRIQHVAEDAGYSNRLPGPMPPLLIKDGSLISGILIYNDSFLPLRYQGLMLTTHFTKNVLQGHRLESQGSSFAVVETFDLLRSTDLFFMPREMIVGPDGAIYLRDFRPTRPHGRIYRLTWAGTAEEPAIPTRPLESWQKISTGSDEQVFQALASPNFTDRCVASRELVRRGAKHRPALIKMLLDEDASAGCRIAALGALQSLWNADVQLACTILLTDANPDLRRLAAEALALELKPSPGEGLVELLVKTLSDRDPAVRRAVALALGNIGGPVAADALVNAYRFDDGKDLLLHDGLLRAIERLGPLGMDRLITLAESGRAQDLQVVAQAFAACRTRHAAEALPRLLANPHLTVADTATVLRALALNDMDQRGTVAASLLLHREPTVVRMAIEVLSGTSSGAEQLGQAFLDKKLSRDYLPEVVKALEKHIRFSQELARMLEEVKKAK
jgi:quinoprotein glucose dehydrogenase